MLTKAERRLYRNAYRGVLYLTDKHGDPREYIDRRMLDISDEMFCMLGQTDAHLHPDKLTGDYEDYIAEHDMGRAMARRYGFSPSGLPDESLDWCEAADVLTQAFKDILGP